MPHNQSRHSSHCFQKMETNSQLPRSEPRNSHIKTFVDRGGPLSEFESNCYVIKTHNLTDFSTRSVWSSAVLRKEVTSLDPRPLLYKVLVRTLDFAEDKWKEGGGGEKGGGGGEELKNGCSLWKPYDKSCFAGLKGHQGGRGNCTLQQILTSSRSDSPKARKVQCPYCNVALSNKGQLTGHLRIHTGEKPFLCQMVGCGKAFARNEELTRHKRTHSGEKPFKCQSCCKDFGRKDHLKKHEKTHLKANEKPTYFCNETGCGNKYTRSDALTRHISAAHGSKP